MGAFNPGGPISNLTPAQINASLTETQKNSLTGIYPERTGQIISYADGDDGFFQHGRPTPGFLTLSVPNFFGNFNRFTNDKGGAIFNGSFGSTVNYAIDWVTGYGWCILPQDSANWATAINKYLTFSLGPYSNFFIPNANEILSIIDYSIPNNSGGGNSYLNYLPFNLTINAIWTSTTYPLQPINAFFIDLLPSDGCIIGVDIKTNMYQYLLCRKHLT